MIFRDLVTISMGNLWRMKLRTFLTVSGVVIAIAAFVAMLSFGAGMQKNINTQFDELGLFSTMLVYPQRLDADTITAEPRPLNDSALSEIAKIPGIIYAYPYSDFIVTVIFSDSQYQTKAQALPEEAVQTKLYSQVVAGESRLSDSLKYALVTEEFLSLTGLESPDSVIGKQIIVSAKASSVDSGLINIINNEDWNIRERLEKIHFDSLLNSDYRSNIVRREANDAIKRFMDGYLLAQVTYSDTLTISGVLEERRGGRLRSEPIIIPVSTAKYFKENGAGTEPTDILASFQNGSFFFMPESAPDDYYPQITLVIENDILHKNVSDSVKTLGFRTFSYAEQFEKIQQFFIYFDMGLGLIGIIALITASLGIVNTMVMSIVERRKEIGILKSLGADENYIRYLFLAESAVIGSVGAILGIIFGWVISRVASLIVKTYMEKEGIDVMELFDMPLWLIISAFFIGLLVSLLAGYFPSSRAARIDPVMALRNE